MEQAYDHKALPYHNFFCLCVPQFIGKLFSVVLLKKAIVFFIFIMNSVPFFSQNIFGEFSFKKGYKYGVVEILVLQPDSSFNYEFISDLSHQHSKGYYKSINDTLFFYSNNCNYVNFSNQEQKCIFLSISNIESMFFFDFHAILYFRNSKPVTVNLESGYAEVGYICKNKSNFEREILEYKLKEIDKVERIYYSYFDIDSIVFNVDNKKK